jgi:hypothetical protein
MPRARLAPQVLEQPRVLREASEQEPAPAKQQAKTLK